MPSNVSNGIARPKIAALESYVTKMWPELTRSSRDALLAVQDTKLQTADGARWPLYIVNLLKKA